MLKVEKYGEIQIRITDTETEEVVYDATPDIDCILEALAHHFDEDLEVEEKEVGEARNPLVQTGDNDDDGPDDHDNAELELDSKESSEDGEEGSTPYVHIQIDDGNDYPNDDEDEAD